MLNYELLKKYSEFVDGSKSHPDDKNEYIKESGTKIFHENVEFDDEKIPADVYINSLKEKGYTEIHFTNCQFNSNVNIIHEYSTVSLSNCICRGKFYINNQYAGFSKTMHINAIAIHDTKFEQNFKLHNAKVQHFTLKDTDFEKNADFFKTHFEVTQDILFHTINFRALALFGEVVFDKYVEFKYVTFAGYSHFRSATFKEGLNLEYANIEKEMNFFDIKELDKKPSQTKTSQETYRIIKYHLQKVGNIIDSNRYHSLELKKKNEQVCEKCTIRTFPDCIVLTVHKLSSNYSTSWILALVWIVIVGIVTNYALNCSVWDENLFKYMSILSYKEDLYNCSYLAFFSNKIALGYLYYQFVMAIRKDTRR